ncbi:hypothetical protein O6H91_22G015300 [Diphasiastrum complanatum]|uniref:Uncharacterized protein n=1 Tax=Diphasiastrum complanatum TaxID=34168 RepID=A0ACC2AD36_DIPCM|nr:hypothetical protein O6H91_22G015300 [Diphasiastrum complanatum]
MARIHQCLYHISMFLLKVDTLSKLWLQPILFLTSQISPHTFPYPLHRALRYAKTKGLLNLLLCIASQHPLQPTHLYPICALCSKIHMFLLLLHLQNSPHSIILFPPLISFQH